MTATENMELDQLKQAWQRLDRRLEQQQALNLRLLSERLAPRLRPPSWGQWLQLASGVMLAVLAGSFWWRHLGQPHLLLDGLLLHLYAISFIVFAARVLGIQARLAELEAWRRRAGAWFAAAGCIMWVPMTVLAFYAVGADLWLNAPAVVWSFYASGLACLAVLWGIVRLSRRLPGLRHVVERSVLGAGLLRARAALEEIRRFQAE